jgi:hypothetical protein
VGIRQLPAKWGGKIRPVSPAEFRL